MLLNNKEFFDFIDKKNVFIYGDLNKPITYDINNKSEIDNEVANNCDVYYFDETVAYFKISYSIYHFYIDQLSFIFYLFKKNPDCLFLLEANHYDENTLTFHFNQPFLKDLFKVFDDLGLKYKIIDNRNNKKIAIFSNSTYKRKVEGGLHKPLIDILIRDLSKYIKTSNTFPNKKVYLSRSKVIQKDNFLEMNSNKENLIPIKFKTDIRINNEKLIEDFFADKNFEIIHPEDFSSLFDQINFMNNTRLLISSTSAGLTNCLFMQTGQKVVELSTDVAIGGREEVHPFFFYLSFIMNHQYISIPHLRQAEQIIKSINETKYLLELVNG